jgi:beta-N-acetylhexosaminidase
MLTPLTPQQTQWVEQTLASLSTEHCIAQMLNISSSQDSPAHWLEVLAKTPVGALSARTQTAEAYQTLLAAIQAGSSISALVLANMEHGAAEWATYGTDFPWPMAAGAANDEALMAVMGEATAVEARHLGVNWVLCPVVDLNINPNNPITNIRSLGDQPERVGQLASALIRALQQHGVAATAKHFPGDGMDDRDQHLVTTVNTLRFDEWMRTFGQVWKAVIDAGVMTIMPGHISLPDYQGFAEHPEDAPPATISRALLTDLLRGELGFEGVIVSDASGMIGLASRVRPEERAVASIAAGIDVYLNANLEVDFPALVQAATDGRLSEAQIRASTRRVLELKARLNLVEMPLGPAPTSAQTAAFQDAAQQMAERSMTVLRNNGQLPVKLSAGAKVLTVTIAQLNLMMGQSDLTVFDEALRERGFVVEHVLNPRSDALRELAKTHEAVFVNIYNTPFMTLGNIRVAGDSFINWGWRELLMTHPQVCYTAFGSPYVGYELPQVSTLLATYGGTAVSQKAAVRVWLGEIEAQGVLPVRMPRLAIQALLGN